MRTLENVLWSLGLPFIITYLMVTGILSEATHYPDDVFGLN